MTEAQGEFAFLAQQVMKLCPESILFRFSIVDCFSADWIKKLFGKRGAIIEKDSVDITLRFFCMPNTYNFKSFCGIFCSHVLRV